jgi:hypothetical protein
MISAFHAPCWCSGMPSAFERMGQDCFLRARAAQAASRIWLGSLHVSSAPGAHANTVARSCWWIEVRRSTSLQAQGCRPGGAEKRKSENRLDAADARLFSRTAQAGHSVRFM